MRDSGTIFWVLLCMKFDWKTFSDRAVNWLVVHGPKIIIGLIVLIVGLILIKLLSRFMKRLMDRRDFDPSLRYFLQNLVAVTLQILLIIFSMQLMGIELTWLTAIFAGLTVAAGLALSGTLNNFVSGVLILILRPYQVGDNLVAQGQEGTVKSIQLFYTLITTYDNKTIIVPNSQLSNNVTINLSREGDRRLDVVLKFNYGIEYDQVRTLLDEAIQSVDAVLKDPEYRIGITLLDADRYTVEAHIWVPAHGFRDTNMLVNRVVLDRLKQGGIKLPGMA